jgi:DNA-binding response OmpR family regulator
MLTGRTDENDVVQGWQAGIDGYLMKPCELAVLKRTVQDVLDAEPYELAAIRSREIEKARMLAEIDDA